VPVFPSMPNFSTLLLWQCIEPFGNLSDKCLYCYSGPDVQPRTFNHMSKESSSTHIEYCQRLSMPRAPVAFAGCPSLLPMSCPES
jgi:hypothetical protein